MMSSDMQFRIDIGDMHINIETFIDLERFKLVTCVITVFNK
jgi:hypothetical protein